VTPSSGMWFTDVSEERITSISVTKNKPSTKLFLPGYLIGLPIDCVVYTCEASVNFYRTGRCHIPEYSIPHISSEVSMQVIAQIRLF
jgi:hypothetical protein